MGDMGMIEHTVRVHRRGDEDVKDRQGCWEPQLLVTR